MKLRGSLRIILVISVLLITTGLRSPENTTDFDPPVIWHDLVTPDLDASEAFYSRVFGWTFKRAEARGLRLATVYREGKPIAGVIEVPKANSAVWLKAMVVINIKEQIQRVEAKGGKVLLPMASVPGRGRQAVLEGPDGEEFSFVADPEGGLLQRQQEGDRAWGWSELWADDPQEAKAFYEEVFGVAMEEVEFEGNPYWVFTRGEDKLAGMIKNPITNQGTRWVPYVRSDDPGAVISAAEASGAFIILPPRAEVRQGKVGIFQDPQGAVVCVQQP